MAGRVPSDKRSSAKGRSKGKAKVAKTTKKAGSRSGVGGDGRDKTPYYVLAIMALVTMIVLLLNEYYGKDQNGLERKDVVSREISVQDVVVNRKNSEKESRDIEIMNTNSNHVTSSIIEDKKAVNEYRIYLVKYNELSERVSLEPVIRRSRGKLNIRVAMNELIKGPEENERGRGLLTAVPSNLKLKEYELKDQCAILDFNRAIEENANGDILLMRIDQILYTITQFDNIDSIMIMVEGKRKKFLGGEGLSINGPITKRR
ncbi:MAG: GerMN domain-containing protein [Spirochaetota bacterium]|nr:GerMN domain-containing protein [Spirochaetota bacterium]